MLCTNEISRHWNLRYVSDGYLILQQSPSKIDHHTIPHPTTKTAICQASNSYQSFFNPYPTPFKSITQQCAESPVFIPCIFNGNNAQTRLDYSCCQNNVTKDIIAHSSRRLIIHMQNIANDAKVCIMITLCFQYARAELNCLFRNFSQEWLLTKHQPSWISHEINPAANVQMRLLRYGYFV